MYVQWSSSTQFPFLCLATLRYMLNDNICFCSLENNESESTFPDTKKTVIYKTSKSINTWSRPTNHPHDSRTIVSHVNLEWPIPFQIFPLFSNFPIQVKVKEAKEQVFHRPALRRQACSSQIQYKYWDGNAVLNQIELNSVHERRRSKARRQYTQRCLPTQVRSGLFSRNMI